LILPKFCPQSVNTRKFNSLSELLLKSKHAGSIVETIRTVVYAVVIALFVRTVAYEPFNIPSASMVPTLLIGDYLFVSKFSYGYSRYSLPFGLPLLSGRLFFSPPERGDVVVFKWPVDDSTDYIKRVIGTPGDRIRVTGGVLYINDKPVKLEPDTSSRDAAEDSTGRHLVETLPNGVRHRIDKRYDTGFFNDWPSADPKAWHERDSARAFERDFRPNLVPAQDDPTKFDVKVPDGKFLMMGDNRDNSSDSRFWGLVPAENLVGKAQFNFFSTNGSAHLWEPWKWPFAIRYYRLFEGIR